MAEWHTRTFEGRVEKSVRVQVPLCAILLYLKYTKLLRDFHQGSAYGIQIRNAHKFANGFCKVPLCAILLYLKYTKLLRDFHQGSAYGIQIRNAHKFANGFCKVPLCAILWH